MDQYNPATVKQRSRPTLKELQAKEYPFPDNQVPEILEHLVKLRILELRESKWPEEVDKVNDPAYCKYHRLVGHPTAKCFVLKDKIMQLVNEGKVMLEEEAETAITNLISITHFGSYEGMPVSLKETTCNMTTSEEDEETKRGPISSKNLRRYRRQCFDATKFTEDDNARIREKLEALDEKRLKAKQRLKYYQARMPKPFNKKVRVRSFQKGDLVLAVRRPIITTHRTGNKFTSKWDGPYVVQEVYSNGAYKIVAKDGLRIGPINGKFLKRYYP